MQVILLERIEKLGQMGDVVRVKDGFARNYLLPKKKALRATEQNRSYFESQRSQLEARNIERRSEAQDVAKKLEGNSFVLLRQAGDRGQLYGSVSPRDIADVVEAGGFTISRSQVPLDKPIKTLGLFPVSVVLHPEVRVQITINVARTEEEAERQARGEDVLAEEKPEEEAPQAEVFEKGAGPAAGDEVGA